MNAGKLNRRIDIEQTSDTRTASGARDETWSAFASSVCAEIKPLSGRELQRARQEQVDITTKITIRFRRGITEAMRVKYIDYGTGRPKYYDIDTVIDVDEAHREIEILCREAK